MTMPTPDPYAGRRAPGQSYGRPGAQPDTIELYLAGAVSSNIVVSNLHAPYPIVTIDGTVAKQSTGGYQRIPMVDGTTERLAVYGTIPGLLTIRFRRTTIYKSPRPSFVDVVLTVLVTSATLVAMAVWLAEWRWVIGVTVSVAIAVASGSMKWLRASDNTTPPRVVLLAWTLVMTAAAVLRETIS